MNSANIDGAPTTSITRERDTVLRFALNGIVATAAHYATLVALIEVAGLRSAGLANGLAAIVGITVSYLGNRRHVFRSSAPHAHVLPRFLAVYGAVALLHGSVLYVWTDLFKLNYSAGFVVATAFSVVLTYIGNRLCVFSDAAGAAPVSHHGAAPGLQPNNANE